MFNFFKNLFTQRENCSNGNIFIFPCLHSAFPVGSSICQHLMLGILQRKQILFFLLLLCEQMHKRTNLRCLVKVFNPYDCSIFWYKSFNNEKTFWWYCSHIRPTNLLRRRKTTVEKNQHCFNMHLYSTLSYNSPKL